MTVTAHWRRLTFSDGGGILHDLCLVCRARASCSDATLAAAEDVERGEGGLLDPLPVVVQRPALLRHGVPGALHLRLDLAVAPLDLAARRSQGYTSQRASGPSRPSTLVFGFLQGLTVKPESG